MKRLSLTELEERAWGPPVGEYGANEPIPGPPGHGCTSFRQRRHLGSPYRLDLDDGKPRKPSAPKKPWFQFPYDRPTWRELHELYALMDR
ncbi:MAG TPA: hypothetical protein VGG48_14190 [Rhizomicrobium sp.]|jgi:hypothetical protein